MLSDGSYESLARAVETCWQRETNREENEYMLGKHARQGGSILCSHLTSMPALRGSFYGPEKGRKHPIPSSNGYSSHCTAELGFRPRLLALPTSEQLDSEGCAAALQQAGGNCNICLLILRFQFFYKHRTKSEEPGIFCMTDYTAKGAISDHRCHPLCAQRQDKL